jgi:large subunit ribosomal protein L22
MSEVTFEARAVLKNYRSTALKSRRVINLVRGKNVDEARSILKFSPQGVSEPVLKLLNSAVANALTRADRLGLRVNEDDLFVSEVFADEGPTMKRFRPRARGTAGRILKRTSHITLTVATNEEVLAPTKESKKSEANAKKAAKIADDVKGSDDAQDEAGKNQGPAKKAPSKAPGKQHKSVGPKEIKAHGDTKGTKAASGHRKENMRKKGA